MGGKTCPTPHKRSYGSKAEAEKIISAMRRQARGKFGQDLQAYGCVCGKVHVGKSAVKFAKRIKRVTNRKPPLPTKKRRRR